MVLLLTAGNALTMVRRWQQAARGEPAGGPPLCDVRDVFVRALRDQPGRLLGIGAVYALDGLIYFYAHSNIGAVTYTVLAQTKIFFTVAVLRMRGMLGKLTKAQLAGLFMLFVGANLVTLKVH